METNDLHTDSIVDDELKGIRRYECVGAKTFTCQNCREVFVDIVRAVIGRPLSASYDEPVADVLTALPQRVAVWPNPEAFYMPHESVPERYHGLLKQTYASLEVAPEGAAVLCRRLVEDILAKQVPGLEKGRLVDKIEKYVEMEDQPRHLRKTVDAIRDLGNFGAHTSEEKTSGDVISVTRDEAQTAWKVAVSFINHYFIEAAEHAELMRRVAEMKAAKNPIDPKAPILPPEPTE
jgi:hypothetical protein